MKHRRTPLARMLHSYRVLHDLEQRGLAAEIGMSASTLCRLEAGMLPDVTTFMRLLVWMLAPEDRA